MMTNILGVVFLLFIAFIAVGTAWAKRHKKELDDQQSSESECKKDE